MDKTPTSETFIKSKMKSNSEFIVCHLNEAKNAMNEYATMLLRKQADVIHNHCMADNSGVDMFDKDAILTASENFIKTIK
jgi:hypothetical protein